MNEMHETQNHQNLPLPPLLHKVDLTDHSRPSGKTRTITTVHLSIRPMQPFDAPSEHGLLMACGRHTRTTMNALVVEARRMALSKGRSPASTGPCVVYFLRLRSGALYIGASEDLEQRLDDHHSGQACRTTYLDPPASFARLEVFAPFSEARHREAQLKRRSRAKKEALVKDDWAHLQALSQSRESIHC
ncbi:MAG: GIY-YIG nuclease family protein [Opitutaceae bacterium]|nr:GIY-YIG nuclease family protein [Opitutaceae bacterium]